jgi:hypothetical protein
MVAGRRIRPTGWPIGPRARRDRLMIAPDGVTWLSPGGSNTVRYDQCVAVRHWDGRLAGPVRELWGADGFRVVVNSEAWRGARS